MASAFYLPLNYCYIVNLIRSFGNKKKKRHTHSRLKVFKMLVVAVAGGTGNVGRTIVEELRRVAKFKIVLLIRGVSTQYLVVCIHVVDC